MPTKTQNPEMTATQFQDWYETQPERPRYELHDGVAVAMSPERVHHAKIKHRVARVLEDAVKKAGLECHTLPDGMTVVVDDHNSYEPDALVYCGAEVDGNQTKIPAPLIVVEVLSPGTRGTDLGDKFTGYFSLASVQHYLILDPVKRLILHHQKQDNTKILTAIITEGAFELDPPGLALRHSDIF